VPHWQPLRLPPGNFTWAVGERAAHLGAIVPAFARGAASLAYLSGISMSSRELELCTEGLGAAYTLPEPTPDAPAPSPDVLYLEADAVQVHFRDSPDPATRYQEVKVFCCWRQTGATLAPPKYWADTGPWDTHVAALETLAEQEGLHNAKVVVALGDGAHPLWTLLTAAAPQATQILDWYHVQEHLATVAAVLPEGATWHSTQRAWLKAGHWRRVIRTLAHLARAGEPAAVREPARKCCCYLFRHRRRLDYRTALARGYPIGSGRIESACKHLVTLRCKGPGMRWQHAHLTAVLHARCAWCNGDWDRACRLWRAVGHFAPPGEAMRHAA